MRSVFLLELLSSLALYVGFNLFIDSLNTLWNVSFSLLWHESTEKTITSHHHQLLISIFIQIIKLTSLSFDIWTFTLYNLAILEKSHAPLKSFLSFLFLLLVLNQVILTSILETMIRIVVLGSYMR